MREQEEEGERGVRVSSEKLRGGATGAATALHTDARGQDGRTSSRSLRRRSSTALRS